jgi:hypothetical protein
VFSGEFGEASIVPLIVAPAKPRRTIAIDAAPGDGVWPSIMRSLSKARIADADPGILTPGSEAGCESAGDTRRSMEIGENPGVLLWTRDD